MNTFALVTIIPYRWRGGKAAGLAAVPFPGVATIRHGQERVRLPRLTRWVASVFFCCATCAVPGENPNSIINSKHNLSVSGPGNLRAATESDVCVFCHAPHNKTGPAPLWNHAMSAATYTPYSSSTLRATVGQPTGASKLCLSCHDGTVALGMVTSRSFPIPMQGGAAVIPAGRTRIGTDLSGHHPVSFTYDSGLATARGELRDPSSLIQDVRLDRSGQLQCTSCHDPHNNQYGQFLVKDNTASALCLDCHAPNQWAASVHATSTATWNGNGLNPWPHTTGNTVAANACESCHRPHDAGTKPQLLNFAVEEQNCYSCHSGTVADKNMAAEFSKASVHPITQTAGVHDPTENALNSPRHVECVDCHNPHAAKNNTAIAPNAPGALAGVKGINSIGAEVSTLQYEYELCFRCHGDSGNRGYARVPRVVVQTDTREEFDPANASYHPVVAAGRNPNVPSLISPWTEARVMYCGDCHNNDQGPGAGGTGPRGPHGSPFIPLLERNLVLTDYSAENNATYALCYKCHSQAIVTSEQESSWKYHKKHVVENQTACTTCHDPHGVQANAHLINFNSDYVSQNGANPIAYVNLVPGNRYCTLSCHGKPHDSNMKY